VKKPPSRPTRPVRRPAKREDVPAAVVEAPEPEPKPIEPGTTEADVVLSVPEPVFAARVSPAEPDRPVPTSRRAIFFDVENTSRAEHIARVIDHLAVDRLGRRTEFMAIGNWKVIGHDTARLLAHHGAYLVHSAPSTGVRDWSDLRIAVSAGAWLASARAGDILEIVSDDRAFDAVGDVAASLGIAFRRLSYRGLVGGVAHEEAAAAPASRHGAGMHTDGSRRRRRGRRRPWHDRPQHAAPAQAAAPPERREPAPAAVPAPEAGSGAEPEVGEAHTAPHDAIVGVVRDLMHRVPGRGVTLDVLANALKSRGFRRTPGSPRLITRLRRIRELEVSSSGLITLVGDSGPNGARSEPPLVEERAPEPDMPAAEISVPERREPGEVEAAAAQEDSAAVPDAAATPRRRSRRGGRGRRGRGKASRPEPAAT
jgi:hypothetical protein